MGKIEMTDEFAESVMIELRLVSGYSYLSWKNLKMIQRGDRETIVLNPNERIFYLPESDVYCVIKYIKPVWYFSKGYSWRFYFGKTLGSWTLNIGTPFFDCGRAW